MREYEIRLFSASGRIAEVYVIAAVSDACAMTKAGILTETHPEFSGAEVRADDQMLSPRIETSGSLH